MSNEKQKLLGNLSRGLIFVMSAPAGTGKTTLANRLLAEFPLVQRSITFTTRLRRQDEIDGIDYYFIQETEFLEKEKKGEFLECVELFGARYGTCRSAIEKGRKEGFHQLLVIDTQGAAKLMGKLDATFIFIAPPSFSELRARLEGRSSEKGEELEVRLSWAKSEIECSKRYDYIVVNDSLDVAYQVLRSILIAEERRKSNNIYWRK